MIEAIILITILLIVIVVVTILLVLFMKKHPGNKDVDKLTTATQTIGYDVDQIRSNSITKVANEIYHEKDEKISEN
ncbi:hypothetical protein [Spiroplasma endosymbiont of Labia minor]|uniref:hypothetical protein n=1 Tax=Spiroplasma endosymbiont of Labia minor TaxID=3066305 RepID=UPI0030CCD21B